MGEDVCVEKGSKSLFGHTAERLQTYVCNIHAWLSEIPDPAVPAELAT